MALQCSPPAGCPAASSFQSAVLEAIAPGAPFSVTTRASGVHRSTIYNRMHSQPGFADAAGKARLDYAEHLRDQLRDLPGLALARLRAVPDNSDAPPAAAIKAALAALYRPHFPAPGWHLPERVGSPVQRQALDTLAARHAEPNRMRVAEKLRRP
jgi:hypothetical protein